MDNYIAPLVSVDWLVKHLDDPKLVILYARLSKVTGTTEAEERTEHIVGARLFDIKNVFSDTSSSLPNTFPTAKQFQEAVRTLGITKDSTIVIYDEKGIYASPRAWWLFRSFGHKKVAVLDGGLPVWLLNKLPVEALKPYKDNRGDFKAEYINNTIKNYKEVLSAIDNPAIAIIDARSEERYLGLVSEPRAGLRSGHIPSSKCLHYSTLLEGYKMLSKERLRDKFSSYRENELIFSCGSGITACILALGADIAGLNNISVYDGSWTEWGSKLELPIETSN